MHLKLAILGCFPAIMEAYGACNDFMASIHAESPTYIIPVPPTDFDSPEAAVNFLGSILSDTAGAVTGTVGNQIQSASTKSTGAHVPHDRSLSKRRALLEYS